MSISRVTGSHAEVQYGSSGSARTLQYGGNLTSGSLLEVTVTTGSGLTITVTVSDDVNGSYTQADTYSVNGSNRISKWYFPNNASTGQPTVTVTPFTTSFISIAIDEYTGVATSSPVRGTSRNTGSGGATATTGSITATAGDLIVTGLNDGNITTGIASVDSPFTLLTNLSSAVNQAIITAFDLNASGNLDCTFNAVTTFGTWASIGVSYKAAAGASVGGTRLAGTGNRPGFPLAGKGGLAA